MERMITLVLSFAFFCSVDCGIVETNYGYQQFHQPQIYYPKEQPSVVQDATKQSPVVVSLPHSNYQQFPNVHPYNIQTSAQIPYTGQQNAYLQGIAPYSQNNQYSVHQPFQSVGQNLYLPYQQIKKPQYLNQPIRVQVQSQPTNAAPQIQQQVGQKIGAVKSVPLFHHQVYHPLHTSIQHGTHAPQQNPIKKPQLAPPTPPRIYKNFHPIIPPKPAPVHESQPQPQEQPQPQQEEEKEEINEEEEEEENEKQQEEDDHSDQKEESEEEFYPEKFMNDDEEDHGRYRHRDEAEDDEDHDESHRYESRPSRVSSKYPKNFDRHSYYKAKHFPEMDFKNFRDFKDPKVEFKMYKYSKSSNKPNKKEYIEGKGSENVPVVQSRQNSYKEKWVITSKSSSMSDE